MFLLSISGCWISPCEFPRILFSRCSSCFSSFGPCFLSEAQERGLKKMEGRGLGARGDSFLNFSLCTCCFFFTCLRSCHLSTFQLMQKARQTLWYPRKVSWGLRHGWASSGWSVMERESGMCHSKRLCVCVCVILLKVEKNPSKFVWRCVFHCKFDKKKCWKCHGSKMKMEWKEWENLNTW